ncbi:T9SS type B sorting domain-containing protein [Algoriphagus hitonicola]|uniref:Gliding motility-associated C-terminal domain-containing protein n=1 Tax=Algoriphagus hitonicola TaxID=435880 RepID=A0A1I2SAL1_9BACT|nr:gliding motility-associated C-terminal domain-containing protein [Algoriphagus hitonicola]SFG47076.1 gliding motility-associated C-terminal domain-containing protein [Algoriphagus hitonicola]
MKKRDYIRKFQVIALLFLAMWSFDAFSQKSETTGSANHRDGNYDGIRVEVSGKLALCSHSEKGFIILDVSGGKAPYTFKWNTNETTQNRDNLNAGTYTVEIKDSNGLVHIERIIVQPPFPLILDPVETHDASCGSAKDGYAKIGVKVGRGEPYKVVWSHGPKDVWELSDLSAGTYTAVVYDMYNCDVSVSFEIKSPEGGINVSENIGGISCSGENDGSINLAVAGGVAPYTYKWNTGATNKDISNLSAGNYEVTITDSNGCSFFGSYAVTAASPLEINSSTVPPLCNSADGSISLSVSGGTAPFTYDWNTGATSSVLENLAAGTYSVVVTDANGCSINSSYSLWDSSDLEVEAQVKDASCQGNPDGTIALSVSGGATPYTFAWSHGPSDSSLTELEPGDYEVTVQDANGCQQVKSFTVAAKTSLHGTVLSQQNPSCFGAADGQAELEVSGAVGEIKVIWSDGVEGPLKRTDLKAGTYSIQILDENSCTLNQSLSITDPEPIQARISTVFETDCELGIVKGKAVLTITGGKEPYKINWNTGDKDLREIPVYQSGILQVTITDNVGCQAESSIDLDMPAQSANRARVLDFEYRKVEFSNEPEVLVGEELEFISEISEDLRDWTWDFGDGIVSNERNPVHVFDQEGEFQVTLTAFDPLGCPVTEVNAVLVTNEEAMMVVPNAFTPNGDGLNDTFIPKMRSVNTFSLEVFNIWGEKLFITTDIESKGWDGSYQGNLVQPGNYVYRIHYSDLKGEEFTLSGGVTLVR